MVVSVVAPAAATAEVPDPVQWPSGPVDDPDLEATAHSIRFAGADRYQTNLATTLALRGMGGYPFDTPDRTDGGAPELASADGWWGARTCPYSIIVVAGDTFADALAAASLSDPTNRSSEPRVQRVAADDPLFDPIGGFDRVDTDGAPIIVTRSSRSGATALDPAARISVSDLATGGCTTAREAIIVGGESAIAPSIASELVSLGYREVFHIAGRDRYETAAAVATALGTGSGTTSTGCVDRDADDGDAQLGWYGNAVAEFRLDAGSCRLLTRSVVLADGFSGADALAAGWWTSYWQVPTLLVGPDGQLPPATRAALQTLAIDNVIVLGGTGRIPEATAAEAGRLAGASVGRIAGRDRYETSVAMARSFGGWFLDPSGTGRSSMVCLAASGGQGATATGWPDALAAGPFCGRLTASGAQPLRALAPIEGPSSTGQLADEVRARTAVPMILMPSSAVSPTSETIAFLGAMFDPSLTWCAGTSTSGACRHPGFGVVFGGTGVVPTTAELTLSLLLSGSRYIGPGDVNPTMVSPWSTELELGPVFRTTAGTSRACWERSAFEAVRWVWARRFTGVGTPEALLDLAEARIYRWDADGTARSEARSAPACLTVDNFAGPVIVEAASLSGAATTPSVLLRDERSRTSLDAPVTVGAPAESSGVSSERTADDEPAGTTSWRYRTSTSGASVIQSGRAWRLRTLDLELSLTRGQTATAPATFTGTLTIATDGGQLVGTVGGEAILGADEVWRLRGRSDVRDLAGEPAIGGFTSDISLASTGSADDRVQLNFDAWR